jgi:hypothetical protein
MSKRPISESEDDNSKRVKTSEINDFINCVVCNEIILPPILQCAEGHLICSECKKHCNTCPQCRCRLTTSRNFIFEKIIEDMKFKCKYLNCNEKVEYKNLIEHHKTCKNKPYSCYKKNCGFESGELKIFVQHLVDKHKTKYIKLKENEKKLMLNYSENTDNSSDEEQDVRRQVVDNYQISLGENESAGTMDLMSDLLGLNQQSISTFGRTVSHTQENFISWNQILVEYKENIFIIYFEKRTDFKLQVFSLSKENNNFDYKIKFKNNDNLGFTFNSKAYNNIEISENHSRINLEFIKDNNFCITIQPSMIYKVCTPSQIKFVLEFL